MTDDRRQHAVIEFNYWLEVIKDLSATNDDMEKINDKLVDVVNSAITVLPIAASNEQMLAMVESSLVTVQTIQTSLTEIIERSGSTMELVKGRVMMLKRELGMDENDG